MDPTVLFRVFATQSGRFLLLVFFLRIGVISRLLAQQTPFAVRRAAAMLLRATR
jgi:hypothetical protein